MATRIKKLGRWLSTNFYMKLLKLIIYSVLKMLFLIVAYLMFQCSTLFQYISENLKTAGNTINFTGSPVKQRCEDDSSLDHVMCVDKNKEQIEINKYVTSPVENEPYIEAECQPEEETEKKSNQESKREQILTDCNDFLETRKEGIETNCTSYSGINQDNIKTKSSMLEVDELFESFQNLIAIIPNQETKEEEIQTDSISYLETREEEIQTDYITDPETREKEIQTDFKPNSKIIKEGIETKWNLINDDLFNLSSEYSIANFISEDLLQMSRGIPSVFKSKFGNIGSLMDQNIKVGHVAEILHDQQYIFYLVVKKKKSGTVLLDNFVKTIYNLFSKMNEHGLKKLVIPKSGLDFCEIQKVKEIFFNIFNKSDIEVSICTVPLMIQYENPHHAKVIQTDKNLWEMQPQTDRILFINLEQVNNDNWNDEIVENINVIYPFKDKLLQDINIEPKAPGEILIYKIKNELLICIFISSINLNHSFYKCLEKSYNQMKSQLGGYRYLALQKNQVNVWIPQRDGFSRCVTLLQLIFNDIKAEIWICGIKNQYKKHQLNQFQKNGNADIKPIKNEHSKINSQSRYINRTLEKKNNSLNNKASHDRSNYNFHSTNSDVGAAQSSWTSN